MTVFSVKQVVPVDCEAEVSQRLLEASLSGDLKSALECIADSFVDINFVGAVSLKCRKSVVVLRDESPCEVCVDYEEFKTDVTALFIAVHVGNVALVKKLLVLHLCFLEFWTVLLTLSFVSIFNRCGVPFKVLLVSNEFLPFVFSCIWQLKLIYNLIVFTLLILSKFKTLLIMSFLAWLFAFFQFGVPNLFHSDFVLFCMVAGGKNKKKRKVKGGDFNSFEFWIVVDFNARD